ncbi:MAG: HAMP domain-containing sensor histidine kinase [Pseudomonadota bacterium]
MSIAVRMPDPARAEVPESFWRSLVHLNHFRLFLALALGATGLMSGQPFTRLDHPLLFTLTCAGYLLAGLLFRPPLLERSEQFDRQVVRQVLADIACLGLLMHLSGGNASGMGLLLIVTVAAVGMLRDTRVVLFWAAMASLTVLGEQTLQLIALRSGAGGYVRAGLLSMGFFGVALLSHALAQGTLAAARLAQEKSRQAESLARINERVIQELPYGVVTVGPGGEVLQFNARSEILLGAPFMPGRYLAECCPSLAELWRLWRQGRELPGHPFMAGQDGRRLRARFIELEPSRGEGVVVVLEDMTDLEAQAQKMKLASLGMLTANLAHEIRNPLSAIRHAAGLLKEDAQAGMGPKLTRIIEDNVRRLNGLVEDVLALNRRDRMNRQELHVASFLAAFVQHFSQREAVPDGVILVRVDGEARVCMDPDHLEQILWNLFRNAWRYCSRRPESMRLAVGVAGRQVEIELGNDGPPISPDVQAHLFEPFYTTDKQGTGLGLYIARELAEANRAHLRYVDNPDSATFRLTCQASPC